MEENRAFAEKFHFNFPLLCDPERKIGIPYGATDNPKGGSAKRISYLIGTDGKIEKVFAKVDSRNHPGTLLEELAGA